MKSSDEKKLSSAYAEGAISVLAVLRGDSREIYRILISPRADRENRSIAEVLRLAEQKEIPVEVCPDADLAAIAGGTTHGGLLAEVGERRMLTLTELFSQKSRFAFLLCGIEDPYNFGDAVRSLYAFGADAMILTPRNWLSAAAVTIRSSAGATELIPCAVCEDEEELTDLCRKSGMKLVCACEKDAESLHRANLSSPLLLVIGGEKRGITKSLLAHADARVRIPYGRNFNQSLSASAAAAAIGFEITRQARQTKFSGRKSPKGKHVK